MAASGIISAMIRPRHLVSRPDRFFGPPRAPNTGARIIEVDGGTRAGNEARDVARSIWSGGHAFASSRGGALRRMMNLNEVPFR